jgi:hypothetical protein
MNKEGQTSEMEAKANLDSRNAYGVYGEKGPWHPTAASLMPLLHSAFPPQ